jgi:DNA-binding NtrC family response regulator
MGDLRELVTENQKLLRGKEIGTGFWEALNSHDWPGNTRELITVLTRAGIDVPSPILGDQIGKIIARSCHDGIAQDPDETMKKKAVCAIHAGKSFWEVVWRPFILREFNKNEVRGFLADGYASNHFNLKKLSESLNIREADYKKFVAVLHKYGIHPKKID